MSEAPHATVDPFAVAVHPIDEPDADHAALRAAGPIVRAEAPAGGPAWIITDEPLARQVLADPRITKDPAFAPATWDRQVAGLEPPSAEQRSLTTLDGEAHAALRRAHAPLFTARRIQEQADRIHAIASDLLAATAATDGTVDLVTDFTVRYPLAVICDLLGVPPTEVERAVAACVRMTSGGPGESVSPITVLQEVGATALHTDEPNPAKELLARCPAGYTEDEVSYLLFGMLFAGQVTTEAALGFLIAHVLNGTSGDGTTVDELVRDVLAQRPPAPYTLWRFTTVETEIAGVRLPARSPVLVDIDGINTVSRDGRDLTFGAGAHYCIGAQLAQQELRAAAHVLRTEFPDARLAVGFDELRRVRVGAMGQRLASLPVLFRG